MRADVEAYWKQFDTPAKSIKNSLQSLKIFAGMPDSIIDSTVKVIETAFVEHRAKSGCALAIQRALTEQSFAMIKRTDIASTSSFIMAGLRNSNHVA